MSVAERLVTSNSDYLSQAITHTCTAHTHTHTHGYVCQHRTTAIWFISCTWLLEPSAPPTTTICIGVRKLIYYNGPCLAAGIRWRPCVCVCLDVFCSTNCCLLFWWAIALAVCVRMHKYTCAHRLHPNVRILTRNGEHISQRQSFAYVRHASECAERAGEMRPDSVTETETEPEIDRERTRGTERKCVYARLCKVSEWIRAESSIMYCFAVFCHMKYYCLNAVFCVCNNYTHTHTHYCRKW